MKKLMLLLVLVSFACKKKTVEPEENNNGIKPVVKTNLYSFRSTNGWPNTRFNPSAGNIVDLRDTVYYELFINSVSIFKDKYVNSNSTYGGILNIPVVCAIKPYDKVKWVSKNVSYKSNCDYCIFKVTPLGLKDTLNKLINIVYSTDTVPYVKSGNTFTASTSWEFTAP